MLMCSDGNYNHVNPSRNGRDRGLDSQYYIGGFFFGTSCFFVGLRMLTV
jgi:hypothetical protein